MRSLRFRFAGLLVALAINVMPRGRIRSDFHAAVIAWAQDLEREL